MNRPIAPQLTPGAHRQPAAERPTPAVEALAASMARIADRAVVSDIETNAVRLGARGDRAYDCRPMLDQREVPAEWADMASEAIAYAIARGLVAVDDPERPWLVRIVGRRE